MAGIYIHIPFCVRKCSYCDFYSVTDRSLIPRYIDALLKEIDLRSASSFSGLVFDSIYFGGGTPSLLSPAHISCILSRLNQKFSLTAQQEITLEVNPGSMSPECLGHISRNGINRLSIGCQSFNDDELKRMGRIHNAHGAAAFVRQAREHVTNISIDLIYGLPGQNLESWNNTLQNTVSLEPDHISAYVLSWSERTCLGRSILSGSVPEPDTDTIAGMFLHTSGLLQNHGYLQYEVSNFAKPGKESLHNLKYWNGEPYLGLGTAAHSFTGTRRMWNAADITRYCAETAAGRIPVCSAEDLTAEELSLEKIALGLRTSTGVNLEYIEAHSGIVQEIVHKDLGEIKGGSLVLNTTGLLVADEIAARLAGNTSGK